MLEEERAEIEVELAMAQQQLRECRMLGIEVGDVIIVVEAGCRSGQPLTTQTASVSLGADAEEEDGRGRGMFG